MMDFDHAQYDYETPFLSSKDWPRLVCGSGGSWHSLEPLATSTDAPRSWMGGALVL